MFCEAFDLLRAFNKGNREHGCRIGLLDLLLKFFREREKFFDVVLDLLLGVLQFQLYIWWRRVIWTPILPRRGMLELWPRAHLSEAIRCDQAYRHNDQRLSNPLDESSSFTIHGLHPNRELRPLYSANQPAQGTDVRVV